jgi:hypothetical protein
MSSSIAAGGVKFKEPTESITEEEARRRHPGCAYFTKLPIHDGEEKRPAILVWRSRESMAKGDPEAIYWEEEL